MVWLVVESGAIYSGAAIVQLVTYLEKMNAGVIMEVMFEPTERECSFTFPIVFVHHFVC